MSSEQGRPAPDDLDIRPPHRTAQLLRAAATGARFAADNLLTPRLAPRTAEIGAAVKGGYLIWKALRSLGRDRQERGSSKPDPLILGEAFRVGLLLPGDVLAYSGKGRASRVIKYFTLSKISHVGLVYDSTTIVESTSLRGFTGVVKHSIADLGAYEGRVWRLRLIPELREDLDVGRLQEFLDQHVGKEYDYRQAALSGIDWFWWKSFTTERDFSRWFCSELVTAALAEQGLLSGVQNPSETTPADMWKWPLWEDRVELDLALLREAAAVEEGDAG